jgi:hypothetical protein
MLPNLVFAFLMTLVSFGAVLLVVMLGLQAENRKTRVRQETLFKLLESGVYDYRLVKPKKRGNALLGWGIVFTAVGLGVLVGLASIEDPAVLRNGLTGALIPMFVGIGMIVFWVILRRISNGAKGDDEPIVLEKREAASGKPPTALDR